jgi:hypothetical protein
MPAHLVHDGETGGGRVETGGLSCHASDGSFGRRRDGRESVAIRDLAAAEHFGRASSSPLAGLKIALRAPAGIDLLVPVSEALPPRSRFLVNRAATKPPLR